MSSLYLVLGCGESEILKFLQFPGSKKFSNIDYDYLDESKPELLDAYQRNETLNEKNQNAFTWRVERKMLSSTAPMHSFLSIYMAT